jgi:hypothetical protein
MQKKVLDKTQHPFMIKALNELRIEGSYLNIIKSVSDRPIANILNGGKLKAFLIKLGARQGCPLSPLLFNIVLQLLTREIRQKKEIESIQIGKEKVKLSLFTDDIILHLKESKDSHQKTLKTDKHF